MLLKVFLQDPVYHSKLDIFFGSSREFKQVTKLNLGKNILGCFFYANEDKFGLECDTIFIKLEDDWREFPSYIYSCCVHEMYHFVINLFHTNGIIMPDDLDSSEHFAYFLDYYCQQIFLLLNRIYNTEDIEKELKELKKIGIREVKVPTKPTKTKHEKTK